LKFLKYFFAIAIVVILGAVAVYIIKYKNRNSIQPLFKLLSSKETNIEFSNNIADSENRNVLNYEYFYNGGGVAVGDINNDGLEDIFFTSNSGENKLYLNLGNMKFKDITEEACPELAGRKGSWKTGVTMADVNGDGLLDIYVCYSGNVDSNLRRNQLFINQGNLEFKEEAKQYGLDDPGYSTQAAFFDYDNDGDLDMFLLNHNIKKMDNNEIASFRKGVDPYAGDKLFENQNGHFVDVTAKAGIHQFPLTFGLGVAISDINKDGWQDIYVTNDYNEPDYVYINNHDGTFTEKSADYFTHESQSSMGVDIADFNNDGLPDIITLDMLPEDNYRQKVLQVPDNYDNFQFMVNQGVEKQYMRNMLQLNNGDGTFSEIGQLAGVAKTDWSWSPLFADFDNDGFKDLFITNGYLRDYTNKDFLRYWGDYKIKQAMDREPLNLFDLVKAMPVSKYPNYIFKNNHDLTFTNEQKQWGFDLPKNSNGAVYADLDNDGDLDLVVNNLNEESAIYKNMTRENDHTSYLSVKLKYQGANINAIGSKIFLYTGGKIQYLEVNPNRGFESCVSTVAHFGLGNLKIADSMQIVWPDNKIQTLVNIPANQKLLITYHADAVKNNIPISAKTENTVFSKGNEWISYTNKGFDENDFKRQLLLTFMYSKTGPVIATADVNKDGLEDVFISGDKNKTGKIYRQKPGGKFEQVAGLNIGNENTSAISAVSFFDANGDGYPDLYIAKGGYSLFQPGTPALQDELYLNNGSGNFTLAPNALPVMDESSKSCVRPCDYDNDGDMDVFVGGRVIPGYYPATPRSYLLSNDGKGKFTIVKTPFDSIGMVTDARWVDLNNDGRKDLVICGEMMPVMVFINTPGGFVDKTKEYFDQPENGFWFSLNVTDVDGDGKPDLIVGNIGRNSPIDISDKEPAEMVYADFDNNGTIDPFLNFYMDGKSYPFVSRDELDAQLPGMSQKFKTYKDYANATMSDMFGKDQLDKANKLTANENNTVCFLNRNSRFVKRVLPVEAQFSAVTQIIADDFDNDGKKDLLLLGNRSDNRLKIGSIDANYGCLLKGDGKGGFVYVPQTVSGLSVKGDVKSASEITINKEKYILIGISDQPLAFYKKN
jgi:enediyne biosynthesis protein E4